jgi:hypothetical protein
MKRELFGKEPSQGRNAGHYQFDLWGDDFPVHSVRVAAVESMFGCFRKG